MSTQQFLCLADIESVYPIRFRDTPVTSDISDILKIYNGNYDLKTCEDDPSGILYFHLGNYHKLIKRNNNLAFSYYKKSCNKECIDAYHAFIHYLDVNTDILKIILIYRHIIGLGDHQSLTYIQYIKHYLIGCNNNGEGNKHIDSLIQSILQRGEPKDILRLGRMFYELGYLPSSAAFIVMARSIFLHSSIYKSEEFVEKCDLFLEQISNIPSVV